MKIAKKLLSLILAVLMILPGFCIQAFAVEEESNAVIITDSQNLLDEITTPERREYVEKMIPFYMNNYPQLAETMEKNDQVVMFLFEGASDSENPYVLSSGKRDQAVGIVVKNYDIIYMSEICSTFPDRPDTNTAIIYDGIYKFRKTNHYGNAAFNVNTEDEDGHIPCVRISPVTKEMTPDCTATGIRISLDKIKDVRKGAGVNIVGSVN